MNSFTLDVFNSLIVLSGNKVKPANHKSGARHICPKDKEMATALAKPSLGYHERTVKEFHR